MTISPGYHYVATRLCTKEPMVNPFLATSRPPDIPTACRCKRQAALAVYTRHGGWSPCQGTAGPSGLLTEFHSYGMEPYWLIAIA